MSDFEMLLTAWLQGGEIPEDFKPTSNVEEYLLAILNGVDDDIDPKSRADVLLDAIATKYAGYADGITDLRAKLVLDTRPEFDEATTPQLIALAQDLINGFALDDLAAKGATGVARNTLDILDAYSNLPSGGAELNIAFGDTAPEDTSKLWVKTARPQNVTVDYDINNGVESVYLMATTLPTPTEASGCGVVGTKCYLFGGAVSGANINTIRVYDAKTDTIGDLSITLPSVSRGIACGAVGTKIYLFGGMNALRAIREFDAETNTLTTLALTLPTEIYAACCGVVGTKIYIFGGTNLSAKNTIFCFDAEAKTITTVPATLPVAACNMACGVVGTKIYIFGGESSNSKLNTIIQFDTETSSISTITATLPVTLYGPACGVVGTKCYVFGGHNGSNYSDKIYAFDATNETVSTLAETLTETVWLPACGVVGFMCYVFGGQINNGQSNKIDKFTVTFPLNEGDVYLQSDVFKNKFTLLPEPTEVETGVSAVYVGNAQNEAENAEAYLHDGTGWQPIT